MKKIIYSVLSAILGALIFGLAGLLKFVGYGGSNCDVTGKSCDCFCCNMFILRGYESCGNFGLIVGAFAGVISGLAVYKLIRIIFKKYGKFSS